MPYWIMSVSVIKKALSNERLDTKVMYALLRPENNDTFSTDYLVGKYNVSTNDFI